MDLTVAYHVDPANVLTAFQNFGTEDLVEIQRTFVRTTASYGLDIVTGTRSIFALTSKERSTIGPEVKRVVAPILAEYGITVDDVAIGEIHPDREIQARVAESVGIRAELDTKKTELERARIEAQTVETNARKNAELNTLLSSQSGAQAIAVKKLEILRKAIEKWKAAGRQAADGGRRQGALHGRAPKLGDKAVVCKALHETHRFRVRKDRLESRGKLLRVARLDPLSDRLPKPPRPETRLAW